MNNFMKPESISLNNDLPVSLNKNRVLIVDDNPEIHKDFLKVLTKIEEEDDNALKNLKDALFSGAATTAQSEPQEQKDLFTHLTSIQIDSAYQGEEALEKVKVAIANQTPYQLAFIDVRMPPGWDGVFTAQKLWEVDPNLQVVICSAHNDYDWNELPKKLINPSGFLILKKPFDVVEIRQMAFALIQKWELNRKLTTSLLSLIEATLEATLESILVINLQAKIVVYNKLFLHLWGCYKDSYCVSCFNNKNATELIEWVAKQLETPELFLSFTQSVTKNPTVAQIGEWKTKTGKIVELYTSPYYLDRLDGSDKIVSGLVYSFRDITDRKKLETELLHQATHDSLTGLPNRVLLFDRVQQAINKAERYHSQFAVLLLDLDGFKEINDSFGHKVGDIFLKMLSHKLKGLIRVSDTLARLGGDEFVVVFDTHTAVTKRAKELIQHVKQPCVIDHHQLTVTVSIGISLYPQDGLDGDTLLKNADIALYRAKDKGRNNFQFYDDKKSES